MGYHSKGILTLINDEGIEYSYNVESFGNCLILTSDKEQWTYISDKPPVLIDKVKKDIEEHKDQLKELNKVLKLLQQQEAL